MNQSRNLATRSTHRLVPTTALWKGLALLGFLAVSASGQTVLPRNSAALSSVYPTKPVNETAIAAGQFQVMSVYHVLNASPSSHTQIGYAIAEQDGQGGWVWNEEGVIDPTQFENVGLTDPSVAYDGGSGDFLVCALPRDLTRVVIARYSAATGMGPWQQIGPTGTAYDKAWIVAGQMPLPGGNAPIGANEFYITYQAGSYVAYLHSIDGGLTWTTSCAGQGFALTNLDNCEESFRIPMETWPVPRVYGNRALYLAYFQDGIQLVRGDDVAYGAHAGEVRFTRLLDQQTGQPIAIQNHFYNAGGNLWQIVPSHGLFGSPRGWGLDLAVDPTNANRLYVVYHDRASASSPDMNIYMRVLTKVSGATWTVGPRLLVADDSNELVETDQILPAVKVDPSGRIHVVYYDDQDFTQDDLSGCSPDCPTYDVKYAYSVDQGQTWNYRELCDDPPSCAATEPAIVDENWGGGFWLGDYIGIDIRDGCVWTSFVGSTINPIVDPNPNNTLIWSSRIVLP